MEKENYKFAWLNMIIKSDLAPVTRHVLLTLGCSFMKLDGSNCFPSTATISRATGLSERTVCTHLDIAQKEGWLVKKNAGINGKGWKRLLYLPLIPKKALKEVQQLAVEGTVLNSARQGEGTEPDDIKALKEVQSNISVNNKYKRKDNPPTPLPKDFQISDGVRKWLSETSDFFDDHSEKDLQHEFEQFKDNVLGAGKKQLNWDATFRTWIRNRVKWDKEDSSPKPGIKKPYQPSGVVL